MTNVAITLRRDEPSFFRMVVEGTLTIPCVASGIMAIAFIQSKWRRCGLFSAERDVYSGVS